ncbi:MAG: ABC transporter substrate-binding protein [Bacteroidia bacterium]|nr:ABC transporter substrate-binding protein [Bacteroidia bacterium]
MSFPISIYDHLGRQVDLPQIPQRIVSLCPSQTETLVALGVGERLVGRTRFCIHPKSVLKKVKNIGGTKLVDFDRIRALKPDLIIGEKEENTAEMVAALEAEWPVFVTDVRDLESSARMVTDLGKITGTATKAAGLVSQIRASYDAICPLPRPVSCLYLIWKDPWMAVGADTFIDSVLKKCGFHNVAASLDGRYPIVTKETFRGKMPEMVFLSSEPYPFANLHILDVQRLVNTHAVRIVDGEMFSWYGSHLIGVENYLNLVLQDTFASLSLHDSV